VLEADGLSVEEMQRFANWTNLSETTFVLEPERGGDYRVRIFTPDRELPFAGHPTLGTCHAWLAGRDRELVVQECGAGLVELRRTGEGLAFAAPPLVRTGPADEETLDEIVAITGLERGEILAAEWIDNGPGWVGVLLESAERVLAVQPRSAATLDVGLVGFHPEGSPEAIEVRALFPIDGGVVEDPVTGSLNAGVAQWLLREGRLTAPYVARQGTAIGRTGRVHVTQDGEGTIWIGGATRTVVEGTVTL
jgi:PhzF family phenazine biosynthesis protein